MARSTTARRPPGEYRVLYASSHGGAFLRDAREVPHRPHVEPSTQAHRGRPRRRVPTIEQLIPVGWPNGVAGYETRRDRFTRGRFVDLGTLDSLAHLRTALAIASAALRPRRPRRRRIRRAPRALTQAIAPRFETLRRAWCEWIPVAVPVAARRRIRQLGDLRGHRSPRADQRRNRSRRFGPAGGGEVRSRVRLTTPGVEPGTADADQVIGRRGCPEPCSTSG